MNRQGLALFDFDGTITTTDTMFRFILFSQGWVRTSIGLFFLSPMLLLHKLGIIPNWRAKEILLSIFFRGMSWAEFQENCDKFSEQVLPSLIREGADEVIRKHLQRGDRVVIVSASAENWLQKWTSAHRVELLATQLEVVDNKITGRLCGKNCHGDEKVDRIRKHLELSDYGTIHAYGDTRGDHPMLDLSTHRHYKPFRNGHHAETLNAEKGIEQGAL